jgi:hypothetical protein
MSTDDALWTATLDVVTNWVLVEYTPSKQRPERIVVPIPPFIWDWIVGRVNDERAHRAAGGEPRPHAGPPLTPEEAQHVREQIALARQKAAERKRQEDEKLKRLLGDS